jgi:hypothetical protein
MQVLLAWKFDDVADLNAYQHWNNIVDTWKNKYQLLVDHKLCLATTHIGTLFLSLIYLPDMFLEWQEFYENDSYAVAWAGIAHNLLENIPPPNSIDQINPGFVSQFQEAGDSFLCRLDGRFVVAMVDRKAETLRIITNGFGLTPCFRTTGKYGTAVGTRIAPLLGLVGRECVPNRAAMIQMFAKDWYSGSQTPFEEVFQVKPGTEILLKDTEPTIQERCYSPHQNILEQVKNLSSEDYLKIGSDAVNTTITLQMRHSKAALMNLTGGMDSRVVVATAVALGYEPACDVSGVPESKDIVIASRVAEALNITLHCFYPGVHYAEQLDNTLKIWSLWTEGMIPAHVAFARSVFSLSPRLRQFYSKFHQSFSGLGGELGRNFYYGAEILHEKFTQHEVIEKLCAKFKSKFLTDEDNALIRDGLRPIILEGSQLGLQGYELFDYFYWRERLNLWAGEALDMQQIGRHVFAPLCQSLLTSVFFAMSLEEKLSGAWHFYHIHKVFPALETIPFLKPPLLSTTMSQSLDAIIRKRLLQIHPALYKLARHIKDGILSKQQKKLPVRHRERLGIYFHAYLHDLLFSGDEWWPHIIHYKTGQTIWDNFVNGKEVNPLWNLVTIELWAKNFLT